MNFTILPDEIDRLVVNTSLDENINLKDAGNIVQEILQCNKKIIDKKVEKMRKNLNEKKWLLIITSIAFFIVLCLSNSVRADGLELKLVTDRYEVKANESIEIKIVATNDKIYSLYSRLNFEDTRFEYSNLVSDKNFDVNYNQDNKSFTIQSLTNDYEYPENEILATFTLKALIDTNVENIFLEEPEVDALGDYYEYNNFEIEYPKNPTEPIYLKSKNYKIGENDSYEYVKDDKYLYRVSPNTKIVDFIANLETNGNISVYNADGTEETNDEELVKTGMILKVNKDNQIIELTISVLGDIDGNGEVTPTDLAETIKKCLEDNNLNELQILSADIDENKDITPTDLAEIIKITLQQ